MGLAVRRAKRSSRGRKKNKKVPPSPNRTFSLATIGTQHQQPASRKKQQQKGWPAERKFKFLFHLIKKRRVRLPRQNPYPRHKPNHHHHQGVEQRSGPRFLIIAVKLGAIRKEGGWSNERWGRQDGSNTVQTNETSAKSDRPKDRQE